MNLQEHAIDELGEVFYIPDFITEEEEAYLIRKIQDAPQYNWKALANRRLQLWGGQLTSKNVLLAQPLPSFVEVYPNILDRLKSSGAFSTSPHKVLNHIILNEYLPGQGIMPHQDGPAYHPVVATISLRSHTAFHYYRYTTENQDVLDATARIIVPTPVLSVLLEPRSVIITSGSMYTSHLHGIQEQKVDHITAGDGETGCPPKFTDLDVVVANWRLLTGTQVKSAMFKGGALERGVRYSLTCRDVEKVASSLKR
ncbi:hypothetical protein BDP27DRAFT_1258892 [Rhodocollybia butyracea]|uniref:Fe2OG dioxygenase domain-containing protein n=1 Tax=Rhodocollybia butyracea TaxID=206335 RepID=A0A9P5UCQ0_9AGAR|nr:hypothetical protein BDP27DRAFT_1258892 [Rhodocollybia butyracea]